MVGGGGDVGFDEVDRRRSIGRSEMERAMEGVGWAVAVACRGSGGDDRWGDGDDRWMTV